MAGSGKAVKSDKGLTDSLFGKRENYCGKGLTQLGFRAVACATGNNQPGAKPLSPQPPKAETKESGNLGWLAVRMLEFRLLDAGRLAVGR
jgi:hypothetical protein